MISWSLWIYFGFHWRLPERPCFRYKKGGKASYHARRTTTFYTFLIQNPAEAKLFCLRLLLCTQATQPALEKMHLHYLISAFKLYIKLSFCTFVKLSLCVIWEKIQSKKAHSLYHLSQILWCLWLIICEDHATTFDIYILKVLETLKTLRTQLAVEKKRCIFSNVSPPVCGKV